MFLTYVLLTEYFSASPTFFLDDFKPRAITLQAHKITTLHLLWQ